MEEERRLCYVAITRAKESLTICHAKQRMLYGRTNASLPSRFLSEIPESIVVKKGGYHQKQNEGYQSTSYNAYAAAARQQNYKSQIASSVSAAPKAACIELNKGDMVQHTAFGKGMVLSVIKMGGDALLEIVFDEIGTKKLMAKTASAHMKRL